PPRSMPRGRVQRVRAAALCLLFTACQCAKLPDGLTYACESDGGCPHGLTCKSSGFCEQPGGSGGGTAGGAGGSGEGGGEGGGAGAAVGQGGVVVARGPTGIWSVRVPADGGDTRRAVAWYAPDLAFWVAGDRLTLETWDLAGHATKQAPPPFTDKTLRGVDSS